MASETGKIELTLPCFIGRQESGDSGESFFEILVCNQFCLPVTFQSQMQTVWWELEPTVTNHLLEVSKTLIRTNFTQDPISHC